MLDVIAPVPSRAADQSFVRLLVLAVAATIIFGAMVVRRRPDHAA